jgi:hypothetical protein
MVLSHFEHSKVWPVYLIINVIECYLITDCLGRYKCNRSDKILKRNVEGIKQNIEYHWCKSDKIKNLKTKIE